MPQDTYSKRVQSAANRERFGFHPGTFSVMDAAGQKLGKSIMIRNDSDAKSILKALRDVGVNLPRGRNLVFWTRDPRKVQILDAKQKAVFWLINFLP